MSYDDDTYDPDEAEYEDDTTEAEPEPTPEPAAVATKARKQAAKQPKPKSVLPIGEVETVETLHGAVSITRGIGLGTKNDQVYIKCELPVVIQPGWTPEEDAAAASIMMNMAKSVVYEHGGLPFTIDEGGIIHEAIRHHFPDAEPLGGADREDDRRQERRHERHDRRGSGSGARGFPHPSEMERPDHVEEEDWDDLCDNYEDFYDNRKDKADGTAFARSPDFRAKGDGPSIWLTPYSPDNSRRGGRSGSNNRSRARR